MIQHKKWNIHSILFTSITLGAVVAFLNLTFMDERQNRCEMTYMYHVPEFVVRVSNDFFFVKHFVCRFILLTKLYFV